MYDAIARPLPDYGRVSREISGHALDNRERSERVDNVRPKTKQPNTAAKAFRKLKYVIGFALLILLLFLVMDSNADMVTQQGDYDKLSTQIVELQSELDYLNFQLEQRSSLEKVEEFATRELGLIKSDNSSITYIRLNQENVLEVNDTQLTGWQNLISQNFLSIIEYLNP